MRLYGLHWDLSGVSNSIDHRHHVAEGLLEQHVDGSIALLLCSLVGLDQGSWTAAVLSARCQLLHDLVQLGCVGVEGRAAERRRRRLGCLTQLLKGLEGIGPLHRTGFSVQKEEPLGVRRGLASPFVKKRTRSNKAG